MSLVIGVGMKVRGYALLYALIVVLSGIVSKAFVSHVFCVSDYQVTIDSLLASSVQNQLQTFVAHAIKNQSMQSIIKEISKNPCIQSVTCSYAVAHQADLAIIARVPRYVINNAYVITDDGTWTAQSLYSLPVTQYLVRLVLPNNFVGQEVIQKRVNDLLKQIPPTVLKTHLFCMHDEMSFCLHDKQDPWFSIVFNHLNVPTYESFIHCEMIKNELKEKEECAKKFLWAADIRFENQIIVSMSRTNMSCIKSAVQVCKMPNLDIEKGGYHDGSRIF
jgi:hypothetical protein